jgi:hypothetical protein
LEQVPALHQFVTETWRPWMAVALEQTKLRLDRDVFDPYGKIGAPGNSG